MARPNQTRTLATPHGTLRLPAFLPDATRGAVRAVDADDLRACGVQAVVVNTFHLAANPGTSVVAELGGIHRMMNWAGPVLSDSGGFQIHSLLAGGSAAGAATREGFHYRLDRAGPRKNLSAEGCIRKQVRIGSDICVCLDHCTHPSEPPEQQDLSVRNTIAWAHAGRAEFDRLTTRHAEKPMLFAVVQGGNDPDRRRRCADELLAVGFDGYGFGGWPVADDGRLVETVHQVAELIGPARLLWALGIGKPHHVAAAAEWGYDLFDCVIPTRDARHNRLYVFRQWPPRLAGGDADFYETLHVQDKRYVRDAAPVDTTCDCPCCRAYSRAYLHHLFHVRDCLAYRLATLHNLRFYTRLMAAVRAQRDAAGAKPETAEA